MPEHVSHWIERALRTNGSHGVGSHRRVADFVRPHDLKVLPFELQKRPPLESEILGPRGFALIMVAVGILALIVAMLQPRQSLRALRI